MTVQDETKRSGKAYVSVLLLHS